MFAQLYSTLEKSCTEAPVNYLQTIRPELLNEARRKLFAIVKELYSKTKGSFADINLEGASVSSIMGKTVEALKALDCLQCCRYEQDMTPLLFWDVFNPVVMKQMVGMIEVPAESPKNDRIFFEMILKLESFGKRA